MEKKKKSFKPLIIVLIIVGIIVFGVSSCVSKFKKALNELQFYESYNVEEQNLSEHISVSGSIASDSITNESSELVGVKVKKVYVSVGDTVKKGDILVEYDVSSYRQQLSKAQADEKKAKSGLQKAYDEAVSLRSSTLGEIEKQINDLTNQSIKAKNLKDKLNSNDISILLDIQSKCDPSMETFDLSYEYCSFYDYVSPIFEKMDEELTPLNAKVNFIPQINVLINKVLPDSIKELSNTYNEENIKLTEAVNKAKEELDVETEFTSTIKELKESIEKARVKASRSGNITSVNVVEGSMQAQATVVATIQGDKEYKVTVPINEVDILKVKKGMKASITCVATGKKTYSGYVSKIITTSVSTNEFGEYQSGASYSAEVVINDTDTDLLVGMSAKVSILLSDEKNVIAIPYDSYITDGEETYVNILIQSEDKKTYTVKRQKVTIGEEKDYYVEVTDGVKVGDKILLYQNEIAEGTQINAQFLDLMSGMDLGN